MFAARYRQIGAKIKYYSALSGMEQVELADKCCITSQYLSKIERGVAKPSTDLLLMIATQLGVDIVQIFQTESK